MDSCPPNSRRVLGSPWALVVGMRGVYPLGEAPQMSWAAFCRK